ncbi:MAG: histidine kinase dimerization/phospho-acceptor domain-containing protein [bacterium]
MADTPAGEAGEVPASISPKALDLLQGLGMVFSHSALYGMAHSVTTQALEKCFRTLSDVLVTKTEINISVTEDELLIDGFPVESNSPAVHATAHRLSSLSIASFSLIRGISQVEFGNVLELLQATPDEMRAAGGFAAVIGALGLSHVRSKRVTIQQVTEDEMVVGKDKLAKVVGQGDIDNVVKFLKGEIEFSATGVGETIQACAADAVKVGELVVQAVAPPAGSDREEEPARIVEAVRRLYDKMAGGPAGQTQKGKRALVRFLEQLEGSLVANMRKTRGGEDVDAEARITKALEEMKDELRIDTLASEYARKRNAISASEQRILRYIETVGMAVVQKAGLKDKLAAEGLSSAEWDDLVEKSGLGGQLAGTTPDDEAGAAIRAVMVSDLAKSLARLEAAGKVAGGGGNAAATAALAPADLDRVLMEVSAVVTKLADQTSLKIEGFANKVQESTGGKAAASLTRKQIIEYLAEIVQELRQPLSVISSVIDAVKSGMLGQLSDRQGAVLGLAAGSADRLDHLIGKLAQISGMPEGLVPDGNILAAVYKDRKSDKT